MNPKMQPEEDLEIPWADRVARAASDDILEELVADLKNLSLPELHRLLGRPVEKPPQGAYSTSRVDTLTKKRSRIVP